MNEITINIEETTPPVIVIESTEAPTITVNPAGVKGDKGDPGVNAFFEYAQSVPSSVWVINHNLGFYPSITVVDSANDVVIGDEKYINSNTVQLNFGAGFAGKAYLS